MQEQKASALPQIGAERDSEADEQAEAGRRPRQGLARHRNIEVANMLGLIVLVSAFVFAAWAGILGLYDASLALLPLVAVTVVAIRLMAGGLATSGRHLLLATLNFYIFLFALYLGPAAGVQAIFFSVMANTALIFDTREWRHAAAAIAQPLVYLALLFSYNFALPLTTLPESLHHHLGLVTHYLTAGSLLMALAIFVRTNRRYELSADDARKRLSREVAMVKALQDVAIIANNAATLEAAMTAARGTIASFTGWEAGRTLRFASDDNSRGCRLLDELRATGRPAWQRGSEQASCCADCSEHQAAGRTMTVALPIKTKEHVIGAMLFHAQDAQTLAPELARTLENFGEQLSMVEARSRAQDLVSDSHMKMIAAAKMATLGEMAGGIAHEINNPLSVIQGYLARIRRYSGGPEGRPQTEEAIDSINSTLQRITKIVNGLRAFARDSTGDPFELVPVSKLFSDTLALSAERFRNRGIQLDISPVDERLLLDCRSTQISQVLVNLLNNAFDAVHDTPEKRVALAVEEGPEQIILSVEDTGHGIEPAIFDKVQQPFFTTKPVGRGTGLGLSISKGIVESHGGTLEFESVPGRTRFVVRLPKDQPVGA